MFLKQSVNRNVQLQVWPPCPCSGFATGQDPLGKAKRRATILLEPWAQAVPLRKPTCLPGLGTWARPEGPVPTCDPISPREGH